MITKDNIISLTKKLEIVELDGEKVMADFDTGKYYLLKGTANDIWELIQSEISLADIINSLIEIYEIDEETCYNTTIIFLKELSENGFITIK